CTSTASWSAAPTSSRRCSSRVSSPSCSTSSNRPRPPPRPNRPASTAPRRPATAPPPPQRGHRTPPPPPPPAPAAPDRVGLDAGPPLGGVLANLERGAAAAGRDDVRVVDREPGALQAVGVGELGAQ